MAEQQRSISNDVDGSRDVFLKRSSLKPHLPRLIALARGRSPPFSPPKSGILNGAFITRDDNAYSLILMGDASKEMAAATCTHVTKVIICTRRESERVVTRPRDEVGAVRYAIRPLSSFRRTRYASSARIACGTVRDTLGTLQVPLFNTVFIDIRYNRAVFYRFSRAQIELPLQTLGKYQYFYGMIKHRIRPAPAAQKLKENK